MAAEAVVKFIVAEGNQFLKKYIGDGSKKIHELFKTARKHAPFMLLSYEIDAFAKEHRGGTNSGANGEETLTAFPAGMAVFLLNRQRQYLCLQTRTLIFRLSVMKV